MPKIQRSRRLIACDTETTGVDFFHGAKPFFFTSCDENGELTYYEWDVDPLTREPSIPASDVEEVQRLLDDADEVVWQNGKFDAHALAVIGVNAPWGKMQDTLVAAHLLHSNLPKNLTALSVNWLGRDIEPYEDELEKAVKECRKIIQLARHRAEKGNGDERDKELASWRIAGADQPEMPSAGEETWRYDYWLPRAYASWRWRTSKAGQVYEDNGQDGEPYPEETARDLPGWEWRPPGTDGEGDAGHSYWTVLSHYANVDSPVTLAVWNRMRPEIERRDLWEIYRERMKLPKIAYGMERRGLTINRNRLVELRSEYEEAVEEASAVCVNIAAKYKIKCQCKKGKSLFKCPDCGGTGEAPYKLTLAGGASVNNSMREFVFDVMGLEKTYSKKSKTANPTLDKNAMDRYLVTLRTGSPELLFVKSLLAKRKRGAYLGYMDGYERYWLPLDGSEEWYVVHSILNLCGTDTLRWSSNSPNSQNISKKGLSEDDVRTLRYLFGPTPGREWWSLDAKNIELRIPAYESGEQDLIDLFERPNDPPYYGSQHILNFHTVYEDIWDKGVREVGLDKVGPYLKKHYASTWYQWVKNGDFAIQYNCGRATADLAFHREGSFDKLKQRFNKLEALNQKCIAHAEEYGYVETIPDKSVNPRRGYPLMCTRTERGSILNTIPLSYRVQGTAMQWTNRAMVRVSEFFAYLNDGCSFAKRKWPGGYYIAIQQHDEIVPDVPSGAGKGKNPWDYNLPVIREVQRLMALGGEDIGVPTPVGCEYHADNWSEGVSPK